MNSKLILNLSLFGVLFGALSSFGYLNQFEWTGWLLFLILATIIIGKRQKEQPFLHAALSGFSFAFLFYAVQILLMSTYVQTHPDFLPQVHELSKDLAPQSFMIFSGMIFSTLFAIVSGLFTYGFRMFTRK